MVVLLLHFLSTAVLCWRRVSFDPSWVLLSKVSYVAAYIDRNNNMSIFCCEITLAKVCLIIK